ncbi:hypothetical protein JOB18_045018 [Solea senegalensis]|uniref:Uncharacterized protein n=1 Tax=Solea senegalensis TaxID=28829 RepID=A0AAV6QPT4_SOLSE|nr:hypothetical protein JOB18_045018 [Solea senegalensis]
MYSANLPQAWKLKPTMNRIDPSFKGLIKTVSVTEEKRTRHTREEGANTSRSLEELTWKRREDTETRRER